ncbi:MAG TPA: oligosaccharide flippase family protein [Solirubrobacteraceae bacterium]|jgi:O-antigen/teichoic acid export membrane protein|nr:oligosaccharide flippase family protein [Solirubrobacteraceae bacterium]
MSDDPSAQTPGEISETIPDADILASREAGGRFLRGGGLRVVAYGSGLLVGLVSTPLVTRHLGPTDWGHYITVTSVIFIAATLTEGGVGNLGVREFSTSDEAERRSFMSSLLGLRIALSLLGAAGAFLFVALAGYPRVLVEGTALMCIALMLEGVRVTLTIPLTAKLRLGWLALSDFSGQFVTSLCMVLLVVAGASLLPFYAVTIVVALVTLTLMAVLVRREISLRPSFSPARWRALASDTVVYAAATTLGVVYFQIVVVAMSLLASKVQTGYFSLSFRVLSLVNGIPWLLVVSAFPILARAARDDRERLRYALQRLFDGALVVGGLFSLCVIVGAPFAIAVVGGSKYHPSIAVLQILGVGIIGSFLVAIWSFAMLSLRMFRELILVNGITVLAAIALSLLLIPPLHAHGGAIVTATLEIALALAYAVVLSRRRPELRPSLRQVPRVALALAAALAAAEAQPLGSVPGVVIGSLVLFAGLVALRAIPAEFLQALRREPVE